MEEIGLFVGYFVVLFIVIFVVIALMSLALGRMARPKGDEVVLTSHRVIFAPNAMNRAVHESLSKIAIRLRDVTEVKDRFGVGTRIIDIATSEGSLAVRTPRAVAFRDAIRQARTKAVSQPANRGLA